MMGLHAFINGFPFHKDFPPLVLAENADPVSGMGRKKDVNQKLLSRYRSRLGSKEGNVKNSDRTIAVLLCAGLLLGAFYLGTHSQDWRNVLLVIYIATRASDAWRIAFPNEVTS